MEKAELVQLMKNFGLGEYEAKVYLALVSLGPSRAGQVSVESNIPQSKIYDVLNSLVDKEVIEIFSGRPKEYKAVSPNVFLKTMFETKEKELSSLKQRVKEVGDLFKSSTANEVVSGVWTSKGKEWIEFFDRVTELLERSTKYVYAVTRDYSRSARLTEAAKRCVRRGVKIRVIGMDKLSAENYMKAKYYQSLGIELRQFETKLHPRIVIADGREVLMRLDQDPHKKEQFRFDSIWSQDASLTKVMDSYMKSLWEKSHPVDFKKVDFKAANV